MSLKKSIIAPIALLLLWATFTTIGYTHGDGTHQEESTASPIEQASEELQQALVILNTSLDSAYASVGVTYKTIQPILEASCYDCHSAQTVYPWYHSLPIVKGFLDEHVEEAREHLDFENGFPFGGHATQLEQLHEIKEEVEEGEMPLLSYRLLHWGTQIEGDDQKKLFSWIEQSEVTIKEVYSRYNMPLPKSKKQSSDSDDDDSNDDEHDEDDD